MGQVGLSCTCTGCPQPHPVSTLTFVVPADAEHLSQVLGWNQVHRNNGTTFAQEMKVWWRRWVWVDVMAYSSQWGTSEAKTASD